MSTTPSKKIVTHSGIYGIGIIIRNASSLVMLPIYTRFLTPQDFGTIELLSMIVDFVGIFIALQIGQAVFRNYGLASSNEERNSVINSAMMLLTTMNMVGVALVALFSSQISFAVFGKSGYETIITLFSITLLFTALSEVPQTFIRAQERPWFSVFVSVLRLSLQLSFNIWFIVIEEMGIYGVVYSALCSGALISIFLVVYTVRYTGIKMSLGTTKKLAIFSFPLMLATMSTFYMTKVDALLLNHLYGLTSVGLYSLAYKFGFVLTGLAAVPFMSAWEPMRYKIYKEENAAQRFSDVFRMYSLFLVTLWLMLSLFSEELLKIMSAKEYWDAAKIVPWIVLGYVFHCWTDFCNFGVMVSGKTFNITFGAIVGGVVTTILCILLIPHLGAVGAGISACVAFFVRFIWVYRASQSYYRVEYNWGFGLSYLLIAFSLYGVSLFFPESVTVSFFLKLVLVGIYFVLGWWLPLLRNSDKEFVRSTVRNVLMRVKRREKTR